MFQEAGYTLPLNGKRMPMARLVRRHFSMGALPINILPSEQHRASNVNMP